MADIELLEKIYTKVEKIAEDQSDMKIIMAKQEISLEEHIKRTSLAEENLSMLRDDFKPVQKHVHMMNGFAKFITLSAAVAGVIKIIYEII